VEQKQTLYDLTYQNQFVKKKCAVQKTRIQRPAKPSETSVPVLYKCFSPPQSSSFCNNTHDSPISLWVALARARYPTGPSHSPSSASKAHAAYGFCADDLTTKITRQLITEQTMKYGQF
jgi:hypothetical protein